MLLGVYWFFGFPEGLYEFEYFRYRPGQGGHAESPAELAVTVQAPDPAALLAALRAVAGRYPNVLLIAETHADLLRLTLGGYQLSDYDFLAAGELEQALRQHRAAPTTAPLPPDAVLLRLTTPYDDQPHRYGGPLQAVGSPQRRSHAETLALRLDCHLPLARKPDFLRALDGLCQQFGLDVLYYFDHELPPDVNLMLFFTNGRQGVGGQPLRYTDTNALSAALTPLLSAHDAQLRHLGRWPADYPRRGPHVVRITDAEFVL